MTFQSSTEWRDRVRSATDQTRAMTAEKAKRISPAAMAEVLVALNDYWDVLECNVVNDRTKAIYMSMADNFVRWMRDEFVPGCRTYGHPPRRVTTFPLRRRPEDPPDTCWCGHSSSVHIYPESTKFGDCHDCKCELYNPVGGLKGVSIHPLFAFTEDQFRFLCCTECGRFSVLPDGICVNCEWDNDNDGFIEETRPQYCLRSSTKQHDASSSESGRCRFCLQVISRPAGSHGTPERWEAGCDCNDCRSAVRQLISGSGISQPLVAALQDIIMFRRNRNELWLTRNTLRRSTVRDGVNELVRLGLLSRNTDESHRSTYLLHFERLSGH